MLDIRQIREDVDAVTERLKQRSAEAAEGIQKVRELDEKRREIIAEVEKLKAERNRVSKEIGLRKRNKESAEDLMAGMKEVADKISGLDGDLAGVEEEQRVILLGIPNLPHADCPVGEDETGNPVVGEWGEKPVFDFEPKDHVDLAEARGLMSFEDGTRISGSGFVVFRGAGARLERGLISFLLDLHTKEHGYTEVSPPFIIREACMVGTGQLPKFEEDMYGVGEGMFLAPTAEVPVTNLHREQLLKHDELPVRYAAYTPCFRKEAGSAGKDNRGVIRMHQFDKVELVKIVPEDVSFEELEKLRRDAEKVLELLGLHYRTIELCTGDLGFSATKCYDIEVWAPGAGRYLEVSSCSNFVDFQSRRMNLRYKNKDGKNRFCHTLNGSGTALPRLVVALMETYQQADGSIALPEVLHPYCGATL